MTTPRHGRLRRVVGLAFLIQLALAGCGGGSATGSQSGSGTPSNFDLGSNDPLLVVAFGDSITAGFLEGGRITSNNYPNNLQAMLRGLDAGWRVNNRGVGGERVQDGAERLPGVLGTGHPGFVLIMEGTNNAGDLDDPAFIVSNLEIMVRQAQVNRSIPVLGTIPPNFRTFSDAAHVQADIDLSNALIHRMAAANRVVLAEIFDGMNDPSLFGSPGGDPHHPNERGYGVMAGIWFDAMQRAIPAAAPSPPSTGGSSPPPSEPSDKGQRVKRR